MEKIKLWFLQKPLESACWLYLLLSIVPGLLIYGNQDPLVEILVRYVVPGGIAVWLAWKFYEVKPSMLGPKGLLEGILYACPIGILCVGNVLLGSYAGFPGIAQLALVFFTALGEELMARVLLYGGVCRGAADRGWGNGSVILLSGMAFGLLHAINFLSQGTIGTLLQCVYTGLMGALLVWSCRKSGSIWGGVIWHFFLNLTAVLFPL